MCLHFPVILSGKCLYNLLIFHIQQVFLQNHATVTFSYLRLLGGLVSNVYKSSTVPLCSKTLKVKFHLYSDDQG
jgi:hypothetical protein